MELVIPGDLLCERAAAEILEHNEMADEIEKPARLEHPGEHDLQFGEARRRILAPADRAPRLEPFLARAERADAGLHAVRGDQRRVIGEQRRDQALIIFELLDGVPHRRTLVGRVFQLDDAERQPVDEDHDVGAAALLPLDDGELIDRQPVVLLGPLEIDDLRLGAGNRPVRPGVFDIDAVDEHAMQRAVAGEQVRRLDPQQFAVGVEDRSRRQTRVQPGQRTMQPVLQDRVVVSRIAALAAIDPVGDLRSVPDGVAQGLQPAECGLFGIRLGEPGRHGAVHHADGSGEGSAARSSIVRFVCSSGSLSSIRRHTVS